MIFQMLVVTVVVGIVLWCVNEFVPLQAQVKRILNAAVVIALCIWWVLFLLQWAGISTRGL